ncbi:hypothetical protein H0H92_015219 [Tricholoma furcatifolium]|nr:hypothetical protein H0H92_015219 [Tricholoma furcatifolium]
MAYVEQQRLDGYSEAVAHAVKRKFAFDKKVTGKGPGEVYRSDLDYTFKSERKLLPKWSRPYRVVSREVNSYTLETCEGVPIDGRFSARRLRRFEAKEGTKLAEQQRGVEEKQREEETLRRREARGWTARQRGVEVDDTGVSPGEVTSARTPPREGGEHGVSQGNTP